MWSVTEIVTNMWIPLWTSMFNGIEEVLSWFFEDMVFLGLPIGWFMFGIGLFYYLTDHFFERYDYYGLALEHEYQKEQQAKRDLYNLQRAEQLAYEKNVKYDRKAGELHEHAKYLNNKKYRSAKPKLNKTGKKATFAGLRRIWEE